jgi:hypothetical protein
MSIAYRDQSLQLSLEFEGQKALGSLPLDMLLEDPAASPEYPEVKNFVTLEAGFYVRGNTFIAALHREGDAGFGEKTLLPGEFQVDSSAGFSSHGSPAGHLTMELSGPLSGEINCRLGTREQAPQPARGNRNLTSEKAAGETASPGQLTLVSAGETAPAEPSAEIPAASSAGHRAVPSRDSPQTEPYPLAIFDEFAIILEPSAR